SLLGFSGVHQFFFVVFRRTPVYTLSDFRTLFFVTPCTPWTKTDKLRFLKVNVLFIPHMNFGSSCPMICRSSAEITPSLLTSLILINPGCVPYFAASSASSSCHIPSHTYPKFTRIGCPINH